MHSKCTVFYRKNFTRTRPRNFTKICEHTVKNSKLHTLKIMKYKPPTFIISHQHSQGFASVATKTT